VKQEPLVGSAKGILGQPHPGQVCTGRDIDEVCRLSAASDGSDVQDLINVQVDYLKDVITHAPWAANVSMANDWKHLTILTGLDDVVFYNVTNKDKTPTSPELLEANIESLLLSIQKALPKTYVSLLVLPEQIDPQVTKSRLTCKLFRWESSLLGIHWTQLETWTETIKVYNQVYERVAKRWKDKRLTDFGVSLMPFLLDHPFGKGDFDVADCFHPNLASHQGFAVGLWNNLLAKSHGERSTSWSSNSTIACPTEQSRVVV